MRRSRKITMLIALVLALAMFAGCGNGGNGGPAGNGSEGPGEVWNLRLSSQNPVEFADSVMIAWAVQEIYERTDGAVVITHFPAGTLGDYIPVFEEVMMGTVDMIVGTAPTTVDHRMGMLYIPFLITNYDDGRVKWTEGADFFQAFDEIAEDNGLRLMGILPGGLMGIGTRVPLNPDTVWDFEQESPEIRLRLPPLWILQTLADAMQFTNTHSIPFADLYPALMTGVVDGWIGGGPELNYVGFRDAISYFYDFRTSEDSVAIFMNRGIYDSLPPQYSRIISEVMEETSLRAIDMMEERNEYFIQRLRDYGITVFQPTDEEREIMRDTAIRRMMPQLVEEFGQELMDTLTQDLWN